MPPIGSRRSITSSRLACVKETNYAKGLSEWVINIIQKSWRSSTESPYSNAWRQWNRWCLERSSDPLSVPLNEVLEFLCEQFNTGKFIEHHTLCNIYDSCKWMAYTLDSIPWFPASLREFLTAILLLQDTPRHGTWIHSFLTFQTMQSFPSKCSHIS